MNRATGMQNLSKVKESQSVWFLLLALVLISPSTVGCGVLLSVPPTPDAQTLLKSVETSSESLTLEIFQVRLPADDEQLAEQLWSGVDEQRIDLETRRELSRNGFRAGVISGSLPKVLADKFQEAGESKRDEVVSDESVSSRVLKRLLQLKSTDQASVQASELREHLNVLYNSDSGLHGQSFDEVQAAYDLRAERAEGQRAALRLTPELQHGELRNRYAGSDQGIFLVTPSREREAYDQLAIRTELSAGEFLVLGSLPDSHGTLGWAFHGVELDGPAEQKLVLVRLFQVPASEILNDQ